MKTSNFLEIIKAVGLSFICSSNLFARNMTVKPKRPNIILIFLDDMGYSDIGCYGSEISTPNIDRMAEKGIRFTQFYNASKCEPSRAAILSGLYHQEAGMGEKHGITRGITIGQAMQAAGYRTMAVGKWHVKGSPEERGFDRAFGHLSGATDYFCGDKTFHLDGKPYQVPDNNFYLTNANTDFAMQFIEEETAAHPDKPFFLYLAYNAPHAPLQVLPQDAEKYKNTYLKGWDYIRKERFRRQQEMGIIKKEWKLSLRPEESIPAWDTLTKEEQQWENDRMAVYAGMMDNVDQNVGRLTTKLEDMNIDKNTLILFLSDNGASPFDRFRRGTLGKTKSHFNHGLGWANACNTPFRWYKTNQHAGGIATPLIAQWPDGIKEPGSMTDQPGHIVDFFATFIDLAGWTYPEKFDNEPIPELAGKSLLPILKGKKRQPHDNLYFQLHNHAAIISDNWKLVSVYSSKWELYNLEKDRTETNNLVKEHPAIASQLENKLMKWLDKYPSSKPEDKKEPATYIRPFEKIVKKTKNK